MAVPLKQFILNQSCYSKVLLSFRTKGNYLSHVLLLLTRMVWLEQNIDSRAHGADIIIFAVAAESLASLLEVIYFDPDVALNTIVKKVIDVAVDLLRRVKLIAVSERPFVFLDLVDQFLHDIVFDEQLGVQVVIVYDWWVQMGQLFSSELDSGLNHRLGHVLNHRRDMGRLGFGLSVCKLNGLKQKLLVE